MQRVVDFKSAATLSTSFAAAAVATVVLLLPSLPPEARSLPLPLPVFCPLLGIQMVVVYGLLAFAGLRLARARGREPAPYLTAAWSRTMPCQGWREAAMALGVGLVCGTLLVAAVALILRLLPETLPRMLHPPGIAAALVASTAGSLGEEILFRLFLLNLLLRLLPPGRTGYVVAVGLSSLAFAAAHAPAFVLLFGGVQEVPLAAWVWLTVLNGLLGMAFSAVFLRWGIVCAIIAHFGTDLVWHVVSQVLRG